MACIFFKPDNVTHEIEDGSSLIEICDELGDLLFQIVFYAQLAQEKSWFN